jgi:lipopolysaccharide transport system ATP-binding protein
MTYAIRVENLSKRYRLRQGDWTAYRTMRDEIVHAFGRPLRWLRGQAENVTEAFFALDDVSFQVQPGEVLGVIGRNGAGKSTLLKILSRITRPTAGRVELRGRVGSLLEVGTGFHPELTGRENIFLSGAILGMKRTEIVRRFDDIAAFAEIDRFLDTPVKRYSSGMYVRLAFSVAAHLQPQLLIIDEVLAVGDVDFQRKCIGQMQSVAAAGNTVVFVSHNLAAVRSLCTHGLMLKAGQAAAFGEVKDVLAAYLQDCSHEPAHREFTAADHIGSVREMRLRRIELVNAVGQSLRVYWRDPIKLQLDFDVYEPLSQVHLGLGIVSLDGIGICTGHASDAGTPRSDSFAPGRYRVVATLRNELQPGHYGIHFGANSGAVLAANIFATKPITFEVMDHSRAGRTPLATDTGLCVADLEFDQPQRLAEA